MNQRKGNTQTFPAFRWRSMPKCYLSFQLKFFQGSLSHCVHVRLTHLKVSNRMQFCVCVSTIAKQERFRLQSKRNKRPFSQSDAVGSAENYCVFFFFGSLFLFSSQQKRKSEHIKLHNLSILPIDTHNMGHVTNCLTCTRI